MVEFYVLSRRLPAGSRRIKANNIINFSIIVVIYSRPRVALHCSVALTIFFIICAPVALFQSAANAVNSVLRGSFSGSAVVHRVARNTVASVKAVSLEEIISSLDLFDHLGELEKFPRRSEFSPFSLRKLKARFDLSISRADEVPLAAETLADVAWPAARERQLKRVNMRVDEHLGRIETIFGGTCWERKGRSEEGRK